MFFQVLLELKNKDDLMPVVDPYGGKEKKKMFYKNNFRGSLEESKSVIQYIIQIIHLSPET